MASVTVTTSARCLQHDCRWTAAGPGSGAAAEKHVEATGHATLTTSVPERA